MYICKLLNICHRDRDQHYKHKSITACNTVLFLLGAVVAVIAWWLDLQLPMQSVPITTVVVSSNLDQGKVYTIM